jgi:aminopeptidase N
MYRFFAILFASIIITACNINKVVATAEPVLEQRLLDTMVITASPIVTEEEMFMPEGKPEYFELPDYNASSTRTSDLLHTRLDLSFDWEKEQVIGKAKLRLQPYFYPTQALTLDAKGFTINKIQLNDGTALEYTYDDQQLQISLPRVYTREETYEVNIDYVATPRADTGSDAITSDKGLFFINPRNEEPNKPQQIWTQGETEHNSRWFPTIDKPNERCTQEMYLTVADKYVTLSNGLLISSTDNGDGTRTDYWKMDDPHAPYLFMLTIGDFAVVKDKPWNGKPVEYYVEHEFEAHARAIFPHTPEMLSFFSDITGLSYPWDKYSQVVVRDYVSGAMENTTGVIFGEFMQYTERELIDELINDKIVAHEMFHHWFGDYVTCESWANLTLNEGFANYSEYLWLEHKYGRDEADYHLLEEWQGYLSSAQESIHPLIFFGHNDKEDMFDAHSYNKGGAVLHMLRKVVGDDAFFSSLNRYLNDNAYSAVEVDELRMAFEDVTGQDLNWFFDQWFLQAGHPQLSLDYDFDESANLALVTVSQTQDAQQMPAIFRLPVTVDVYFAGQSDPKRYDVMLNERNQTFTFPAKTEPALIVFDAERSILAEWTDNKSDAQLAYQFEHAPLLLDRYQALAGLAGSYADELAPAISKALEDPFYGIRLMALENIPLDGPTEEILEKVVALAKSDPHSEVRSLAISLLVEFDHPQTAVIAKQALNARPYNVIAAGLTGLAEIDPMESQEAVGQLESETNEQIVSAIGSIYAAAEDVQYLPYFAKNMENVDGFSAINFYENYGQLLLLASEEDISMGVKQLQAIGTNMGQSPWRRIASIKTPSELKGELDGDAIEGLLDKISKAITSIKTAETNPQLKSIYQQF